MTRERLDRAWSAYQRRKNVEVFRLRCPPMSNNPTVYKNWHLRRLACGVLAIALLAGVILSVYRVL